MNYQFLHRHFKYGIVNFDSQNKKKIEKKVKFNLLQTGTKYIVLFKSFDLLFSEAPFKNQGVFRTGADESLKDCRDQCSHMQPSGIR